MSLDCVPSGWIRKVQTVFAKDDVPTGVLEDPSMTTFHDRDGRANNDDHYSKLARLMLRIGCYHG